MKKMATLCSSLAFLLATSAFAGDVVGTIKFEGTPPKLRPHNVDKDAICAKMHKEPLVNEALVLGDGNALANVLVSVKSVKGSFKAPSDAMVVTQEGCKYTPHVFGVMAGQPIKLLNPDGTLHNVHAMPKKNRPFNLSMPKHKKEAVKDFKKAEAPFPIKCDVHPWMGAWVQVFDHPYFSVSGNDGKFKISGLPAGDYELVAWHEKMGEQTAKVKVGADGSVSQDFSFKK